MRLKKLKFLIEAEMDLDSPILNLPPNGETPEDVIKNEIAYALEEVLECEVTNISDKDQ